MPRARKTTTEYLLELKQTRQDKAEHYDYSCTEYSTDRTKLSIICPEHGEFQQLPRVHLLGAGCPKCAQGTRKASKQKLQQQHAESFVSKARAVHSDKYDYSLVQYVGTHKLVSIICKQCNTQFKQSPAAHLSQKSGCPGCARSGYAQNRPGTLYVLKAVSQSPGLSLYKFGISNNLKQRLWNLQDATGFRFTLIHALQHDDGAVVYAAEQAVHTAMQQQNAGLTGFDGAGEWFLLNEQQLQQALGIAQNALAAGKQQKQQEQHHA